MSDGAVRCLTPPSRDDFDLAALEMLAGNGDQAFGEECLMSAVRRVFPETFKREAVDRVVASGLSAGAVARELGLHEKVLRRSMMQFGVQATGAARRTNTQAPAPKARAQRPTGRCWAILPGSMPRAAGPMARPGSTPWPRLA
jgi:transposase-like protein